ncbi:MULTISPECIES: tetratricopeptide repeat protein [Streptacidiphilus]|uniref:Tetratricopeptide repeat protein n=1 Tax=Streptacidiphilus cavernicola TaxID=3342716 RepID=A0ABV6UWB6_9ACTN|nr:tetratricopeptide repeat protein [Streptacidiphilus jeojiense]
MADLRALFSSNDPSGVQSAEAFTNRQLQWSLVATALGEHLQAIAARGFDVEDLEHPRNNVIAFYGIGGVGKSTLLRKLEAALTAADQRPQQWATAIGAGERLLPVRIDLSRSASTGTDFERVVLTIRLALAGAVGRPLPGFDLALRRYWDAQHPGEPLEDYIRRTGLMGKVGQLLPDQLQAAVSEVAGSLQLPGMIGSAAGQVATALVHALRERRERAQALAGAARTAALLEAEPDLEALSYYPHLLAWELHHLPAKKKVVPVILLDTFEDTADRHRDLERLLQRLVWLMPGAFFVIAGRNRLPWGEAALEGQLDYTGPTAWPGLTPRAEQPAHAAGGRRQHLLGDFSTADCDSYLARRLTHEGQPLIGPDIRAVITERSHGLPLHLDLSVARFLEIRRTGRMPVAADFDHTFPALIARTLSDLTDDERHVLRSASLLDAFDLDLATRAAGLAHQAPARRLVERPMIGEDPYAIWPYHLHGAIRTALQSDDTHTPDRWTPADWNQAATRALAALGHQWQHSDRTAATGDRAFLVACLRQGLRLARDHHLNDLAWLTDAAFAYIDDSVWEPIAPPTPAPGTGPAADTPADALAEVLTAISRRQHEHRDLTTRRLSDVLAAGLLSDELVQLALYYRAKADKDLGRTAQAMDGMRQVAASEGRLASRARRGLANLARIHGDFPTALSILPGLGWKGRQHRVHGDILWPQGDFTAAAHAFRQARDQAEQHQAPGERAIVQTRLALGTAFTDPVRAQDEIALAHQLLEPLDQRATVLLAQIAALVRDAGTDHAIADRVSVLRAQIDVAGLLWLIPLLETALVFHHAVRDDQGELTAAITRLQAATATGDFAYYVDIAHYMADLPLPAGSAVRWLEDPELIRTRWRRLVMDRRPGIATV